MDANPDLPTSSNRIEAKPDKFLFKFSGNVFSPEAARQLQRLGRQGKRVE